jgi:hypothetical protein
MQPSCSPSSSSSFSLQWKLPPSGEGCFLFGPPPHFLQTSTSAFLKVPSPWFSIWVGGFGNGGELRQPQGIEYTLDIDSLRAGCEPCDQNSPVPSQMPIIPGQINRVLRVRAETRRAQAQVTPPVTVTALSMAQVCCSNLSTNFIYNKHNLVSPEEGLFLLIWCLGPCISLTTNNPFISVLDGFLYNSVGGGQALALNCWL